MSDRGSDGPAWGLFFAQSMSGRWGDLVRFGAGPEAVARYSGGRLVYLATPYSKQVIGPGGVWDFGLSAEASVRAARWAAQVARHGATAVSPIVMAAEMCHSARLLDPLDEPFWGRWCAPLLAASGTVAVPAFAGWQRSRGIWREVCWALQHNLPVMFEAEAG